MEVQQIYKNKRSLKYEKRFSTESMETDVESDYEDNDSKRQRTQEKMAVNQENKQLSSLEEYYATLSQDQIGDQIMHVQGEMNREAFFVIRA